MALIRARALSIAARLGGGLTAASASLFLALERQAQPYRWPAQHPPTSFAVRRHRIPQMSTQYFLSQTRGIDLLGAHYFHKMHY